MREGTGPMVRTIEQLRAAGVRGLPHQQPWLDTAAPTADLRLAVFAWVAKQERERIAERVRPGGSPGQGSGGPARPAPAHSGRGSCQGAARQGRELAPDRSSTPGSSLNPSAMRHNSFMDLRCALD
jgi:DNA invertase Pin-like site-specific DNA recombinase